MYCSLTIVACGSEPPATTWASARPTTTSWSLARPARHARCTPELQRRFEVLASNRDGSGIGAW